MKWKQLVLAVFAAGVLAFSPALSAHHGTAGYDMEKVITLTG